MSEGQPTRKQLKIVRNVREASKYFIITATVTKKLTPTATQFLISDTTCAYGSNGSVACGGQATTCAYGSNGSVACPTECIQH